MDIEAGARRRKKLMTEPTLPIYLKVNHSTQLPEHHACGSEKLRWYYSSSAAAGGARTHDLTMDACSSRR